MKSANVTIPRALSSIQAEIDNIGLGHMVNRGKFRPRDKGFPDTLNYALCPTFLLSIIELVNGILDMDVGFMAFKDGDSEEICCAFLSYLYGLSILFRRMAATCHPSLN